MKYYQIKWHDKDTTLIAANTLIEALQVYVSETDFELSEFSKFDDIFEVSKESLSEEQQEKNTPCIISDTF